MLSRPKRLADCGALFSLPLLPAPHAPAFMLGACGYEDTLTLSAGAYGEERSSAEVEKLLCDIRNLLENPC